MACCPFVCTWCSVVVSQRAGVDCFLPLSSRWYGKHPVTVTNDRPPKPLEGFKDSGYKQRRKIAASISSRFAASCLD